MKVLDKSEKLVVNVITLLKFTSAFLHIKDTIFTVYLFQILGGIVYISRWSEVSIGTSSEDLFIIAEIVSIGQFIW